MSSQDVIREFPAKNRVHLARIVSDMVDKGILGKITRDNYHIFPFNAVLETYVPDQGRKGRKICILCFHV